MRTILALLLLVATGCPASSESSGSEPNRAPPPAASTSTPPSRTPPTQEALDPAADAGAGADADPSPDDTATPVPVSPAAPAAPADDLVARTVTLPGTAVTFELVPISLRPRGDDEPATDARTLWVARTETTWDAYDVFVYGLDEPAEGTEDGADAIVRPSQPYVLADYGFGHAGFPVICVSSAGAEGYCAWLSARTGRRYRLPTEAEWEDICRAAHPALDREALLAGAWVRDNSERKSHAVGTRAADALGLHDLLGNVTEWCQAPDGSHVARGGSWQTRALDVGCDTREVQVPAWNATDPQIPKSQWWLADAAFVGFRVVCDDTP